MEQHTCRFCGRPVTDGRELSGYTGDGPDWMADGDFGCDASPETTEDGCGGHAVTDDEVMAAIAGGCKFLTVDKLVRIVGRVTYFRSN